MKKRIHFRVRGRVQGVFFRWTARERAQALGLVGWIRNCPDGSVEGVAEGGAEALNRFREWLEIGPPGARVESVVSVEEPLKGEYMDFEIVE